MSAWLTIFCTRPVAHLTASDLLAHLRGADLHTAAESFGFDDDALVDAALSHLRVDPANDSAPNPAAPRFRVRYTPPGAPSGADDVAIHLWSDPVRVATESAESLEHFTDDTPHPILTHLRPHLAQTAEVVGVELRWTHTDTLALVLAGQLAECYAAAGHGLIRDQNDQWWSLSDGLPVPLG